MPGLTGLGNDCMPSRCAASAPMEGWCPTSTRFSSACSTMTGSTAPTGMSGSRLRCALQRALVLDDEREDLRRLHRAHQRAGEDERDGAHALGQRREVCGGAGAGLRGQRARLVAKTLGDLRVRIAVPYQENPQGPSTARDNRTAVRTRPWPGWSKVMQRMFSGADRPRSGCRGWRRALCRRNRPSTPVGPPEEWACVSRCGCCRRWALGLPEAKGPAPAREAPGRAASHADGSRRAESGAEEFGPYVYTQGEAGGVRGLPAQGAGGVRRAWREDLPGEARLAGRGDGKVARG